MRTADDHVRKLSPWLRVVKNGDRNVNALRSAGSSRVACFSADPEAEVPSAMIYTQMAKQTALTPPSSTIVNRKLGRLRKRAKLQDQPLAYDSFVNVFIEFFPESQQNTDRTETAMARVQTAIEQALAASPAEVPRTMTVRRNILAATIPIPLLEELKLESAIAYIHPAEALKLDRPEVSDRTTTAAPLSKAVGDPSRYPRGDEVLIGIVDVGGFDFSHPDFLDENGKTRFVAIWDQGGDFRPPPKGFLFGAEFRKEQLDRAIEDAKKAGMPPAPWIEPQSQIQPGSHGTHVASIAAGNSGVCPKAKIAAVLIDIPAEEDGVKRRRSTFSDTSRITEAVEYLLQVAEELKLPIAINISLGTNGGSHDAASGVSRWLDAYLADPGRAICIAAGNAGQERSQNEGDLGWVMGRIHTGGRVPAKGLEVEIEWAVIGDGIEDWSDNELEVWYSAQDRFVVALKPPGSAEWIEVKPTEFVENRRLASGVNVSIYNELYYPTNGGNYIGIHLTPNYELETFRGIDPGIWKVRLRGDDVRDGRFDAWIERDDPVEIGREGSRRMFRFPSFFTERSNVDSHSISSLACGTRVIAVANLDEARQKIHVSSSQGPTRDGRYKPEIAAPGTEVIAANGFADPDDLWVAMTGTSMASPYVTGVVGLMLGMKRELTAAQCLGILQRTARPLAGATYQWVNDVGFGRLDPIAALDEAKSINSRFEVK